MTARSALFVVAVSLALPTAAARAQQGAGKTMCTQGMLAGQWQLQISGYGVTCPAQITREGVLSTSYCAHPTMSHLSPSPNSTLKVSASCEVTGEITWVRCEDGAPCKARKPFAGKATMWRSGDGTRVSGYLTIGDGWSPIELIFRPQ